MAAVAEVGTALVGAEAVEAGDGVPECADGPGGGRAQQVLEFAEGEFDRVQIRTVGWQVEQPSPARLG